MNIDKFTFIGLIDVIQTKLSELQDAMMSEDAHYIYNSITEELMCLQNMKQDIKRGIINEINRTC